MKLHEYECDSCGIKEDRLVTNENRDSQTCACGQKLRRCISAVAGWVNSKGRTDRQLQERSIRHTRQMKERGHDPAANETFRNTNAEWHNKNRTKVTKQGVVDEHRDDWKKWKRDNEKLGLDSSGSHPLTGRHVIPSEE